MISGGSLLLAGASAALSAGGSAYNRARAREIEAQNYKDARGYLNSMYYRDPLSTIGNRSLLKAVKENHADAIDAINNRMVAGGATMENQLAARQAANEGMDKVYGQLLQGEDARRDRIDSQKLQLDQQHAGNVQNSYMQAAQDWQSWGSQMANAAIAYGSSSLLGGGSGAGTAAAAAGAGSAYPGPDYNGYITLPNGNESVVPGGLAGVYRDSNGALKKI